MKILLTSHGSFCSGLLESYEMIAGDSSNIEKLSLTDEGIGKFRENLKELLDRMTENDYVLIFCDMKGGTPFNESLNYYLGHEEKVRVVSGMNLPMLIETGLMLGSYKDMDELVSIAVSAGKNSIEAEVVSQEDEEDDLEF